jgi:hypothetical protein
MLISRRDDVALNRERSRRILTVESSGHTAIDSIASAD